MKFIIFALIVSSTSFAQVDSRSRKVESVNSVVFSRSAEGNETMKVNYSTGGCNAKENNPQFALELISTKDVTPEWAIKEDPKTPHEYKVVVKVTVSETMGICRMGYDISASADLKELFKKSAAQLGIDLPSKKAHYYVEFLPPAVKGYETFSAFEEN